MNEFEDEGEFGRYLGICSGRPGIRFPSVPDGEETTRKPAAWNRAPVNLRLPNACGQKKSSALVLFRRRVWGDVLSGKRF